MASYKRFIFLLALFLGVIQWNGALAAEYPPLKNFWPESGSSGGGNHGNPWRTQETVSAAEAQFVQPSGNPWLEGGRVPQRVNLYPQPAQQMMPRLPQRRDVQAWSSPQSFPFGWMP